MHVDVSRELIEDSGVYADMLTTAIFDGNEERGSGKYPHGKSVKNPRTYEALKAEGMSKSQAAAISNAALKKGHKKGVHHKGRGK